MKDGHIVFHDRLPDTLACLVIGYSMLLLFLRSGTVLKADIEEDYENEYDLILLSLAAKQATAVTEDKPTHIFIRKLSALIESGQVSVVSVDYPLESLPQNFIGYEDEENYYLSLDISHKAVKRICNEQDECFAISSKSLAKALADEGFIDSRNGENTRTIRFGNQAKRVMTLSKEAAKKTFEDGV